MVDKAKKVNFTRKDLDALREIERKQTILLRDFLHFTRADVIPVMGHVIFVLNKFIAERAGADEEYLEDGSIEWFFSQFVALMQKYKELDGNYIAACEKTDAARNKFFAKINSRGARK